MTTDTAIQRERVMTGWLTFVYDELPGPGLEALQTPGYRVAQSWLDFIYSLPVAEEVPIRAVAAT